MVETDDQGRPIVNLREVEGEDWIRRSRKKRKEHHERVTNSDEEDENEDDSETGINSIFGG
jgi:hypothetical protein